MAWLSGHHGYSSYGSCGCSGGCSGHASSGGCWGSSYAGYSSYGCSGSCSGGSVGSSYSAGYPSDIIYETAPMTTEPSSDTSTGAAAPAEGASTIYRQGAAADEALLSLDVPEDAEVFINGRQTTSTGTQRQYVSRGLESGRHYEYLVRVERPGQPSLIRSVQVRGGQEAYLNMNSATSVALEAPVNQSLPSASETVLKLRVPSDAQVELGGSPTEMTGETRIYRTSQLREGQQWQDYTVRVSVVRDGQTQTKEKVIDLKAGDEVELAFDFDDVTLASR